MVIGTYVEDDSPYLCVWLNANWFGKNKAGEQWLSISYLIFHIEEKNAAEVR